MHPITTLSFLALVGSVLAAPAPHYTRKIIVHTTVTTIYVTAPAPEATQTYVAPPPPPKTTITITRSHKPKPQPQPTISYEPAPKPTIVVPAPEPTTVAPAPAPAAPPETSTGYMAIVDEWRKNLGLKALTQDSKLEGNALKTCVDGNGEMVHQLNSGTFGQVLAPGKPEDFLHVFVGGWLCERPNLAGLNGICAEQSKGWTYGGQTGHADILTADKYSKIGCNQAKGIWACDLA